MIPLFSTSFIEKNIINTIFPQIQHKKEIVKKWTESILESQTMKETAIKSPFLNLLFGDLLDYPFYGKSKEYNFKEEENVVGVGQADFVLGYFNVGISNIKAVGELKSLNADLDKPQKSRKDLKSPVEQGLNYLHNLPESAKFLIVKCIVAIDCRICYIKYKDIYKTILYKTILKTIQDEKQGRK